MSVASDRSVWQYPQRANCAPNGSSAVGAALLLGQWWHAAQLLHTARSLHPHRASWTAWLREIPVSESHACKLVRISRAGLASPTLSYRAAYALTVKNRGGKKIRDAA